MRWSASLILVLALTGCGGDPRWSKEGVSPEMAAQDYADCRSLAQSATQRDTNIDTDILASRGHDWQSTGVLSTKRATYAATNEQQSQDVVTRCMIGKGYAPGA